MKPDDALSRLVQILASHPEASEIEIHRSLVNQGIAELLADRAYKFTQIAWGRLLLEGMGIHQFSEDYLCFDSEGRVVETGKLADEPCYQAAMRSAERYARTPAFQRLALESADVHAVNEALHAGSKLEELVASPACIFTAARSRRSALRRHVQSPRRGHHKLWGL